MKALYLLSFILFVGVNAYSHQIELRVLDEKGNPLEKAKIYQPNYSETKKDGIFFIPADSDFVFLHKETFKPKLIFVEKIKNNSVLLEKELKSVQLLIKNCPRRKMKSKGWFDILIPNPRGFGRKTGKDIDYAVFFISKKRGNKEEYLQGISGSYQ